MRVVPSAVDALAAIDQAAAPERLKAQLRARRRGEPVTSARIQTGLIAWRDARATVAEARRYS